MNNGKPQVNAGKTMKKPNGLKMPQQLLAQIRAAARHCQEVEREFGKNPPPELETLIKVHRAIILQLSAQRDCDPETVRQVTTLMKPVMDWAKLQEQRKERELAEAKYRDQIAAQ